MAGHNIEFLEIDICAPGNEEDREIMQTFSKPNSKGLILPPQIFNENDYCGVI